MVQLSLEATLNSIASLQIGKFLRANLSVSFGLSTGIGFQLPILSVNTETVNVESLVS